MQLRPAARLSAMVDQQVTLEGFGRSGRIIREDGPTTMVAGSSLSDEPDQFSGHEGGGT